MVDAVARDSSFYRDPTPRRPLPALNRGLERSVVDYSVTECAPSWGDSLKFIRIVFFYVLFFFLTFIIAGIFIQPIGDGYFVLASFVAPAILVWWMERRRSGMIAASLIEPNVTALSTIRSRSVAIPTTADEPNIGGQPNKPPPAPLSTPPDNASKWQQLDLSAVTKKNRESSTALADFYAQKDMLHSTRTVAPTISALQTMNADVRPKTFEDQKNNRVQGWVQKGHSVSVHGRNINGMVYVGTPPTLNRYGYAEKLRAYIDPSLPVARVGNDKAGTSMSYWPSYSGIPPECRATYLDWIATGAADGSFNPGYMFLYFYGIERRFFVDDPSPDEKTTLLTEARRLVELFSENHSARRYLGEFLEFAVAATTEVAAIQPTFENPGWDVPFSVKLAIGARLQKGENLTADWVLSWFLCHPEKNLRTSARRCTEEFIALFRIRFSERFPQGLKVTKPRTTLKASYQAASREFEGSVTPTIDGKPIPDISGMRKPIEIAQEIADAAMEDLEKFSRYLGRNPEGRGSVEAHALLPAALRQMFPSKELDEIKTWAGAIVQAGGLVPVRDVLERLEGERAEQLGKRQLTGAADALARIGFGMAPDPRFALRSPALNEPVVLFDLGGPVEQLEDVSTPYKAALMELALATFVAHADGAISEIEKTKLEAQTRSAAQLTDHEQKRLGANLSWFIAVPPDLTLLRRKLKETGADEQSAIRAALVAAAHADGIVSTEEVAGIEKVYRALGLDPNLVYSDLHAGKVPDTPMRVRLARPGAPGEAIPAEPQASAQRLDAARIASIRQDTDRVSAVLANIFTTDTPNDEDENTATPSALAGLDAKHTALIREVITRPHWTEEDFVELTARHGLMVAGALETVNEWAFGVHDEALLEEYEGYDVSPDIADALADTFEKER